MVRNDIKKEFGDYQTPGYFAVKVCNLLKDKLKISPGNRFLSQLDAGTYRFLAYTRFNNKIQIGRASCRERV